MARGKNFEHKKKGHPGELPQSGKMVKGKNNPEEAEYLVTQEAFKNRMAEE